MTPKWDDPGPLPTRGRTKKQWAYYLTIALCESWFVVVAVVATASYIYLMAQNVI